VEPLGHEVVVHGSIGDDVLVAKFDPHHPPSLGGQIEVVLELDRMHLFDAATEKRLGV